MRRTKQPMQVPHPQETAHRETQQMRARTRPAARWRRRRCAQRLRLAAPTCPDSAPSAPPLTALHTVSKLPCNPENITIKSDENLLFANSENVAITAASQAAISNHRPFGACACAKLRAVRTDTRAERVQQHPRRAGESSLTLPPKQKLTAALLQAGQLCVAAPAHQVIRPLASDPLPCSLIPCASTAAAG